MHYWLSNHFWDAFLHDKSAFGLILFSLAHLYFKGDLIKPYTMATEDMVAIAAKLNFGAWAILESIVSRTFWLVDDNVLRTT